MYKKVVLTLLICALTLVVVPAWSAQAKAAASGAAADAGEAATAYANALALANTARAWNLLSTQSQKTVTSDRWTSAFQLRSQTAKPPAATVLRALATAAQPPTVTGVLVHGEESLVNVTGNVQIAETIVLVKEASGWRVDLAATDRANAREAAESFLDAVREDGANAASPQGRRPSGNSLAVLRTLLRPEAKNFHVLTTILNGDHATITVAADLPVSLVLRATRSGAGWSVDLTRPVAPVDILSPDPLREAVVASDRQACEDQLRQVAMGIQMYAGTSDDMLPDPRRWMTQISPFIQQQPSFHCASDPTPGVSYAFNSKLAGKRRRDVGNPSQVPMVFESSAHQPNAADAGTSWPTKPWHAGEVMVLYADGSVRATPLKPSFDVPAPTPGAALRPGLPNRLPRPGMPGSGAMPGATVRPVPPGLAR